MCAFGNRYVFNSYDAIGELGSGDLSANSDGTHVATGNSGTWSFSRIKTYHNTHGWCSDILRVHHTAGPGPWSSRWYVRVRSTDQRVKLLSPQIPHRCDVDCSYCEGVSYTAGQGDHCYCAVDSTCSSHQGANGAYLG